MLKKLLRFALLALAAIVVAIAIFYGWTDLAGAWRWRTVEASMRAKGLPTTLEELKPAPIADEQNFAAAPIIAEIFQNSDSTQLRIKVVHGFTGGGTPGASRLFNAARSVDPTFAGTDANAARRVLAETAKWKGELDEVRAAARRPGTVWPLDYSAGIFMQERHLQPMLQLGQALYAEAIARLELGDSAGALEDFQLLLNLAGRMDAAPMLIDHLVGVSITGLGTSVVQYGLDRHRWSGSQLETIQQSLNEISLPAGLARSFRGEAAVMASTAPPTSAADIHLIEGMSGHQPTSSERLRLATWGLRPRGWEREDRSTVLESVQDWIGKLQAGSGPAIVAIAVPRPNWYEALRFSVVDLSLQSLVETIERAFLVQTEVDEAVVASAIERYRLAKGSLPASLDALVPDYLAAVPKDRVDGQHLRYRPLPAGGALLYSIGWNQKDDGGNGVDPVHPHWSTSVNAPDWVWKVGK